MRKRRVLKILSQIILLIVPAFVCNDAQAITAHMAKLHVPFIENQGQVDEKVRFYTRTIGGTVFLTKDGEIVYSLQRVDDAKVVKGLALKEELSGGMVKEIRGEGKSVTKVSYFVGKDPLKWRSNILTYELVNLGEVYRGIGLKLKAYGGNVEKLFYVKPGANPENIKVKLRGAKAGKVNESGGLEVETELGMIRFTKPEAYQEINGKKVKVATEYVIARSEATKQSYVLEVASPEPALSDRMRFFSNAQTRPEPGDSSASPQNDIRRRDDKGERARNNEAGSKGDQGELNSELIYSFKVEGYDRTKELVIDPLLASTFLGGSSEDYANSMAIDSSGNVYVTGTTNSTDLPTTPGAYDTTLSFYDAFVAKFNGDLTDLLALTFLGGSNGESGNSIAIGSDGKVYVTGMTISTNFPTTPDAYDTMLGFSDAFISKFSSDLTHLLASTYLGGSSSESATSIAIDSGGNVYVSGETFSSNFPTTPGAYDTSNNGSYDAFISKLSGDLKTLLASTYLGGISDDNAYSIALDAEGNLYVAGRTLSTNFPTTTGAYDTSNNGSYDAFISKLSGNLKTLLASTYLGGSSGDNVYSIASDVDGNLFVTGETLSINFPTTSSAYNTSYNGSSDAFVSKFNKNLTTLLASTFLGRAGNDSARSIAVDLCGYVYVAGYTGSSNFPTTSGTYETSYNGGFTDAFVTILQGDLTKLLASTFLGGGDTDAYNTGTCLDKCFFVDIAIDSNRDIYVAGETNSLDFPTTSGAYETSFNGFYDVFVSKLDLNPPAPQHILKVTKAGTGSGTVTSVPAGIDCGSDCTATFEACPQVTLTASVVLGSGYYFVGWSGACTGKSETCTVTMNRDKTIKATFNTCTYSISPISRTFYASGGKGTVSVTTQSDCTWDAVPSESWITITSGSSGTGSGTVKYSVSANTITPPSLRTANISIKGKTHAVTQNGAINVLSPTSGEEIPSGLPSYNITWEAPAEAVKFKLILSLDNGLTWTTIANNVSITSYNWPVPTPWGNKKKCIIKVVGYDGSNVKIGAGSVPFAIQVVKLDIPNGGATYTSGNPLDITWTANTTKKPLAKVRLLFTKDGGLTWIPITATALTDPAYLTVGSHIYNTTVPSVTSQKTKCKVKVDLKDASGNTLGTDASDNPFTIQP